MTGAAPPSPPPSASGALAKTPLPHLLVYLLEKQLTGTIELAAPDGERATVLVLEGFPSKARTSEPTSYLGHVLLEAGLVTEAQLNTSMERFRPGEGKLHGQVLLEMGALDMAGLLEGLRRQVIHKLEHVFNWPPETTFAYFDAFDGLAAYGADDMVTVDPLPLVWSAIKQAPSWEHVHAALSRVGSAPLRVAQHADLDRLALTPDERAFVELIRPRPRRIYEMTSAGTIGPSAKQLLIYCLLITRQIEVLPEDFARQGRSSAPPQQPQQPPLKAPPSAVARVQLASRQISKPAGAVEEHRAPKAVRFDPRASNPSMTPPPMPAVVTRPEILDAPAAPPVEAPVVPAPAVADTGSSTAPPAETAASGSGPSTELVDLRKRILRRADEITKQNYFQMLGVARDATADEIQKAYFLLAKVWHPDRLPSALADVRDSCTKVFAHMSEAHQTLTDAKRRGHYMMLMKDGGATPEEQAQVASVLEAATNFQKAEICMKRNDLVQAEQFCRLAHGADPKQAEYLALLAWIEATKPDNQSAEATEARVAMLDEAIRLNAKCERAHFYRGMLNKRLGSEKNAYRDFKTSSELNPRNIDAQREVRLHQMRKGKSMPPPSPSSSPSPSTRPSQGPPQGGGRKGPPPSGQGGGLFGRLFKK